MGPSRLVQRLSHRRRIQAVGSLCHMQLDTAHTTTAGRGRCTQFTALRAAAYSSLEVNPAPQPARSSDCVLQVCISRVQCSQHASQLRDSSWLIKGCHQLVSCAVAVKQLQVGDLGVRQPPLPPPWASSAELRPLHTHLPRKPPWASDFIQLVHSDVDCVHCTVCVACPAEAVMCHQICAASTSEPLDGVVLTDSGQQQRRCTVRMQCAPFRRAVACAWLPRRSEPALTPTEVKRINWRTAPYCCQPEFSSTKCALQ
jgi:hypothetical protein